MAERPFAQVAYGDWVTGLALDEVSESLDDLFIFEIATSH